MHTHALFWTGNAKLDSRMLERMSGRLDGPPYVNERSTATSDLEKGRGFGIRLRESFGPAREAKPRR
jgi:hypothetical protein